jgi:uncharacterized protein (DUF433 family)
VAHEEDNRKMDSPQITRTTIGVGSYSLRDASFLLRIPYQKLRRWAAGYWYAGTEEDRFSEPVVPGQADEMDERILSFHELVELAVVGFYRAEGVSMPVVRAARAKAQQLFRTEYPFATKRLRTDGSGVFADLADVDAVPNERLKIELSKSQVTYRELVEPFFRENLDFGQDGLASIYWPLGREKPVLLDARRSFGQPIVTRTGTPTFVLYQMRKSGETLERIALWYSLTHEELSSALAYEEHLRTAA